MKGELFVDDRWRQASDGRVISMLSPSDGQEIGKIARGSATDVDVAVKAARTAFEGRWYDTAPVERGRLLSRIAAAVADNAEELAVLNAWVRAHSLATLDSPKAGATVATSAAVAETQQDMRGLKADKDETDRTPISSRIVGRFDGWDGQTVFKLENGMIWEQADKDKFWVKALDNPQVTIEPGMFGTWRLSVEGYNSNCRVERIQ